MSVGEPRYLSFLIRLWRVRQNGLDVWRASLEDPRTNERRGFASLDEAVEYLRSRVLEKENAQEDPLEPK